jgi:hypothetical protein
LKCALCGKRIDAQGEHFRASGDFLPPGDPLTTYCNQAMHWPCYAAWPERPRFARHYVDAWVKANRKNPFWWSVHCDDELYVSVNPARPIEEVSVRLFAFGDDIRVPLPRWSEWLADPQQVAPGIPAAEHEALLEVLSVLRERFPDDHAVVHAIDADEKRPRRKATSTSGIAQ